MNYDRLILDLIDRVTVLEKEVANLKRQNESVNTSQDINLSNYADLPYYAAGNYKDKTKYMFNGRVCRKNRLVLAVVQEYVLQHPNVSAEMLQTVFDKSLQGSLGVVRKVEDVRINCSEPERRFFMSDVIQTSTSPCVVCNQWGANLNIERFVARARQLGFKIDEI